MRRYLAVSLVLVIAGCEGGVLDDPEDVVGRYCNWGAESRAQYDGCLEHVSRDEVSVRYARHPHPPSPAATYAIECDLTPGEYTPGGRPGCGYETR